MNKKLGVLILILLGLVSTSIFLTKDASSIEPDSDIKGQEDVKDDTDNQCLLLEELVEDELANLPQLREWYVKSPEVEDNEIDIKIALPEEKVSITYSLNNEQFNDAIFQKDNEWIISIPIEELESGVYQLDILINACDKEFVKTYNFKVSNPVYVIWSIDWEGFDVKEEYLNQMSKLSSTYNVPMTHFFNPYIYIYLSPSRAKYLTNWVLERDDDSIGLHLHMYDNMVKASGVEIDNDPAWGSPMGNGHDTPNSNYGYDDYRKIILWALNQYDANGLPRPTMYRAGGWFIDEENIAVLKNFGFEIESSGRTYYIHGRNSLEGHWNLKTTTQPYQMNSQDQNRTDSPNINIWEYPNNGGDSWAYSAQDMIKRFSDNYKGGVVSEDIVVNYLSHPHWFDKEGPNIEGALKYVSNYTYESDNGPVIFITLDKVHEYNVKL